IRPSGSAGRRSSAFVRQHAPIDARGRPALSRSAGYGLWPLALDVERAFHRCDISTKETNDRGDNSHEGNRGNGSGCGNGRDEAGRAARAAGSDKRRSGFVPTEMAWPSTWTDRRDRDRTPSIPGHELAGVVTALGYGTTGLSVGQRVFGLADWHRD